MSDGNFNRALLPSTPYASGVKMGYQQARTKAIAALDKILNEQGQSLPAELRETLLTNFKKAL